VPSAAGRVAGAGVMVRDEGDKETETQLPCGLAVRMRPIWVAKSEMSDHALLAGLSIQTIRPKCGVSASSSRFA